MRYSIVFGIFCFLATACGSSDPSKTEDTYQPAADIATEDVEADVVPESDQADEDLFVQPSCEWLSELQPPVHHGVVYTGHFLSTDLVIARIDGLKPIGQTALEMGEYTHDMALDSERNLLAVVQDIARQVTLLQLSTPASPADPFVAPTTVATLEIDNGDTPRFARFNVSTSWLYVLAGLPADAENQDSMNMHVYDLSSPATPAKLGVFPVPTSVTFEIDPLSSVMFLVGLLDKTLYLYDITGAEPVLRPGTPVDLRALYPEENNSGFSVRNLTLDPWNGRLLAARSQGAFSEVIALNYPASVANGTDDCPPRVDHDSFTKVDDYFDLSIPVEDRPNLLDAYSILPDTSTGNSYFVADAWNGTESSALVIGLTSELEPAAGCSAFEGFGCWIQYFFDGEAGSQLRTDGAACLDTTHEVVVATSIAQYSEEEPGMLHFFKIQSDLQMVPWLQESNKSLTAGALPVAVVCH